MLKNIGLIFFFLFFSFFGVKEGFCNAVNVKEHLTILDKHISCFNSIEAIVTKTVAEEYNKSILKTHYDTIITLYETLSVLIANNDKSQKAINDINNNINEIRTLLNNIITFDNKFKTNTILETCNNTVNTTTGTFITDRKINDGITKILKSLNNEIANNIENKKDNLIQIINNHLDILNKHKYCLTNIKDLIYFKVNTEYNTSDLKTYYNSLITEYNIFQELLVEINLVAPTDSRFDYLTTEKVKIANNIKDLLYKILYFDEDFKTNTILETCNNTGSNKTYRKVNKAVDYMLSYFVFRDIITVEKQLEILTKHHSCLINTSTSYNEYIKSELKTYYDSLFISYNELEALMKVNFKINNDNNFKETLQNKFNTITTIIKYLNKIKNFNQAFKTDNEVEKCNGNKNSTKKSINNDINDILDTLDFYQNENLTKLDFNNTAYNNNKCNNTFDRAWAELVVYFEKESYNLNINFLKYILYNYKLSDDIKCYQKTDRFEKDPKNILVDGILSKPFDSVNNIAYTLEDTIMEKYLKVNTDLRNKYKTIHKTCLTRNNNGTINKYNNNTYNIKQSYIISDLIFKSLNIYNTLIQEYPIKVIEPAPNEDYTEEYFREKYKVMLLYLQKRELLLETEKNNRTTIKNNIESFLSGYADLTDECVGGELIFKHNINVNSDNYKREIKGAMNKYFLGQNNIDLLIKENLILQKFLNEFIVDKTKVLNQIKNNNIDFDPTEIFNKITAKKQTLLNYVYKYQVRTIKDDSMIQFIQQLITEIDDVIIKIQQYSVGLSKSKSISQNGMLYGMCYVIKLIHGNFGRTIACFAIIMFGAFLLNGKLEFGTLISIVIAFALTFGSISVAELLFPNQISCQTLEIDPEIHI